MNHIVLIIQKCSHTVDAIPGATECVYMYDVYNKPCDTNKPLSALGRTFY